jgi:hypothetical protein
MRKFGSGLSSILPLAAFAMTIPACAAGMAPICDGLKADRAKIALMSVIWDESTPHELVPHGIFNELYYDQTDADNCAQIRYTLPAFLDVRRITNLDPHKCGIDDYHIQMTERVIAEFQNTDCFRGNPRFKMVKSGIRPFGNRPNTYTKPTALP